MKDFLILILFVSLTESYDKNKFASNGGFSDKLVPNSEIEEEINESQENSESKNNQVKSILSFTKGVVPDFNE